MTEEVKVEANNQIDQDRLTELVSGIPVVKTGAVTVTVSVGTRRIGVTIFGRRGTVGVSLKEVEQSKRYAVQISPHHRYGNDAFPHFPYFIPCNELAAVNLINKVAVAMYEVCTDGRAN